MASLGGPDTHYKKSGVCHMSPTTSSTPTSAAVACRMFSQQGHFDRSKAEAG